MVELKFLPTISLICLCRISLPMIYKEELLAIFLASALLSFLI